MSYRVSDKIQRARSDSLPRFTSTSLSLCLSAPLSQLTVPFATFVRTGSFTSPAHRCMFFSDPFLRHSTVLNSRRFSPVREYTSGRRFSYLLHSPYFPYPLFFYLSFSLTHVILSTLSLLRLFGNKGYEVPKIVIQALRSILPVMRLRCR